MECAICKKKKKNQSQCDLEVKVADFKIFYVTGPAESPRATVFILMTEGKMQPNIVYYIPSI